MADERELVTVFRSAEADAETEANQIQTLLAEAGVRAGVFDDTNPGIVAGSWEVRVPAAEAARAEQILAVNPGAENSESGPGGAIDPSHQLDTEPVYQSLGTNAEMEAMAIQGLLQSNGLEALLMGDSVLPQLGFEVRVAREHLEEARALIQQAEADGPEAAAREAGETSLEG